MSAKLFRRFTYLVSIRNQNISEIIVQMKSESIQKKLEEVGILAFEFYKKKQDCFMLVDTKVDIDSRAIGNLLSEVNLHYQKFFQDENDDFSFEFSPIERIYKLDQKSIYTPTEGQLKTSVKPYKRFVWTLLLEPTLIEEYKSVHAMGQAWPEITANMKSVGVKDMEIYLSGTQAILIMDTIPDFNLDEVGPKWQKLPREEDWQAYVAKFQKTNPQSSIQEKWQDMLPV